MSERNNGDFFLIMLAQMSYYASIMLSTYYAQNYTSMINLEDPTPVHWKYTEGEVSQ